MVDVLDDIISNNTKPEFKVKESQLIRQIHVIF